MRTTLASALALGGFVLFACGNDYGSDDQPKPTDQDGGTSSSGGGSSGASGDGGSEGGVTPGKPITVTGQIISYGIGMPNVPVVVGGKVAVNTSALGTFSVPDVQPPYDVVFALKTTDAQPRVTVYQGLTRSDPTLVALGTNGELRPNASTATSLSGKVDGAGGPAWAKPPVVAFGGPNRAAGFATVDKTTGMFTMQGTPDGPTWYGTPAVTGSLHASLVLDGAAPVTAFYGRLDNVVVTSGTAVADKNVTMASVPVAQLEATATAPSIYNDSAKTAVNMGVRFGATAGYFIKTASPGAFPLDLSHPVPLVNGATFEANVGYSVGGDGEASFSRVSGMAAMSAKLAVALAEPPHHTDPSDGAKDVARTTPFTFSAFPNGIHRFTLVAANQPSVTIVTAATSVTLPDLAAFAVTLPAGVEYTWRVAGYRPITSLDADELATFLAAIDGNLPAGVDQVDIAISSARKVTLAP